MSKKPILPTQDSDSNTNLSNSDRRAFIKTVAVGVGSVSFAQPLYAAGESALPSITSILLDDELPIGEEIRFDPNSSNSVQTIKVPPRATTISVQAYGAGGAGSTGNSVKDYGGRGGDGGAALGNFRVSDLSSNTLTLHIGEGATAAEANEASTGGAFGGGDGGLTQYNAETALPGSPTHGGGAGGYTGLFADEQVLLVGGGGGGAGGNGRTSSEVGGGAGGNAKPQNSETRDGNDGGGYYQGRGGRFNSGGLNEASFAPAYGESATNLAGGNGGLSLDTSSDSGGAGGGGGGGYADTIFHGYSPGGGGGGGAGFGHEGSNGGHGGGGAGGASYYAPIASGEPSDFGVGAEGGASGSYANAAAPAGSGGDGWLVIEFDDEPLPDTVPELSNVFARNVDDHNFDVVGAVKTGGGSDVFERGVVYTTDGVSPPDQFDSVATAASGGVGDFKVSLTGLQAGYTYYLRGYARNNLGYGYSDSTVSVTTTLCLAKGTLCRLSDGTEKAIEDISYQDELMVWNFDLGCFDVAKPRWIKRAESTSQLNQLTFSDGSELLTIGDHRIFNKEAGKFTPGMSDETPLGTSTFNAQGETVSLVAKSVISQDVVYYNVITDSHINLFANGVLTSCRLNNLYPIENMRFVKDDRMAKTIDQFKGVPVSLFKGLRLAEQAMSIAQLQSYVENLMELETINVSATTIRLKRSGRVLAL